MHTSKNTVCFIFARGGSKGLPKKNLKVLGKKPLIAHSIGVALDCERVSTVIVSTDDDEIAAVARAYGAETPFMRPMHLATDDAPEWLAWQHAVDWYQSKRGSFDFFLSLPATSPFRSIDDVNGCLDVLTEDRSADMVITVSDAARSPYFNMVKLDEFGYADLLMKERSGFVRRQDVPPIYDVTTVAYAGRSEFILKAKRLFDGNVRAFRVPIERALDIDTPFDFMIAEAIVANSE